MTAAWRRSASAPQPRADLLHEMWISPIVANPLRGWRNAASRESDQQSARSASASRKLVDPRCELGANGRRLAEQTSQPADIEHHAVAAVALQPRRKLFRDGDSHIGSTRGSEARIQRRHDRSASCPDNPRLGVQSLQQACAIRSSRPARARLIGAVISVRSFRPAWAFRSLGFGRSCGGERRLSIATVAPPELRARCSAATSTATVWLPSITRARRNQVVNGSARTVRSGTSARSSTTSPNPPACRTRFMAFSARVASPVSRIHNSRDRSSPGTRPIPDRSDRWYRRAPPARHGRRPPRAHSRRPRSVLTSARRRSPTRARVAGHRRAPRQSPAHRWPRGRQRHAERPRQACSAPTCRGHLARQRDVELPGFQQRFDLRARGRHQSLFSLFLRLSQAFA